MAARSSSSRVDDVIWAAPPDRHEAGSPNVVGAVALGGRVPQPDRARDGRGRRARAVAAPSGCGRGWHGARARPLTLWPAGTVDRVGVATFNLDGYRHPLLAAILSAEHAIGVRHGCFCAHPLMTHLLRGAGGRVAPAARRAARRPPSALPGAVRASIGLGTTDEDVDRLSAALREIAAHGPRSRYLHVPEHDEYRPREGRAA